MQLCFLSEETDDNWQLRKHDFTDQATKFLNRSIASDVPANTFIVVDMHSDALTGELRWAAGSRSGEKPTSGVVTKLLGSRVLESMQLAASIARNSTPPVPKKWYDVSVHSRGGWRGLLLAACGPVMRVDDSFEDVRGLVQRYRTAFTLPSPMLLAF